MKSFRKLSTALCFAAAIGASACTSAVVGASATRDGRPLLWKNRDTSHTANFVASVAPTDSTYGYTALFNAGDSLLSEAWIGMNERGFAVMNTASYNLAENQPSLADREGLVMTTALRRCATVDEFEALLRELPKPLGVRANFGAIDATGAGAYFEVDDYTCRAYRIDEENPVLVRSNFSVSGRGEGLGVTRYHDACRLLAPGITACDISPELLTDGLSRSFYCATDDKDHSSDKSAVDAGEYIPRWSTSASIVVEGVAPSQDPSETVMWTLMGYPPAGVTLPVTLTDIPADLRAADGKGAQSTASQRANATKSRIIHRDSKGRRIIDMKRLAPINDENRSRSLENYRSYRNAHPTDRQ